MELRSLRDEAQLTIEQVAKNLKWSESKVSRIETGRITATPQDVQRMLRLYGVEGKQLDALVNIAGEARAKGWWQRFHQRDIQSLIGFESAAKSIHTFEVQVVPGFLQTEEYARAVLRATHPDLSFKEIDRRVDLRVARHSHLLKVSGPPHIWAILDEPVVRRPVGGAEVMKKQVEQLLQATEIPEITIQILPLNSGEHAGMDGSFTILNFTDPIDPAVVYVESATKDNYLDDEAAVNRYSLIFDHLRASALKPADSLDLLTRLANRAELSDRSGIRGI
jgi:transcriptional regulator with XRE-family HTH domain